MGKKITDKVTWVGKVDWGLKRFHGDEYSTHKGSSYNSYLIRDKKTVLIDTVWQPYDKEFVSRLKEEIDLKEIDYIIANHNEIDHSGALPELMREIPGTPIYCTKNGAKIIKGHYHEDWNFVEVKTGDTLDIGQNKLIFVEAPMLHWPDTMFTYLTGENILFSNDGFGQHFATELLYNDKVDQGELYEQAIKYYANILNPFSTFVKKKINEILKLNLPLSMICPSHGVIWRENPAQIVEQYLKWADSYQEDQITFIYDTMWNSTRKMAEAIAEGIHEVSPSTVIKLMNSAKYDKNDIITEVFRSKAILVGSPTINNGYLFSIGGIVEMIKGLKFKGKSAAAFGSYGWSGEVVKQLTKALEESGFKIVDNGHRSLWIPDEKELDVCREYGRQFVKSL
ncbi:anaerobic nitric oxide reductase flavorubredoxin [Clostridium tyrobutyricum]|jgi:flavorubredoxin|uniref:Anaerobic nitric oxide reductase flavorubredoxin n=1 Tax=Clostridium tyrobutyricum DIVETGP TaxID=1408889 RepID=W6N7P9_CLOTY|nr:anaerobic nitric oxide reductase flavorubredoxin [Clostridium tyrobutyricum]AND83580.1 flavoprotein [Clostridium tyrobutyricum]ANP68361.1 MBL fold hydrolase [Clostridium tyrobutyricum]MBV4433118.1 anaerobic nitric oxide reductase flavorubredoxin [Clostridium tyrobutyricum]MBV4439778.1 anaerobic nitric oxide reductase flavorubredoxin [Clostridium tyrobutyricum]MBV4449463.1 anaerobic nitric oxide reductase flavorubredoxin [Clostridium tyrobutyricum]